MTINRLSSGYRSSNALNADLETIEDAFNNTLSRDGTGPNQMEAPIDMNSNRIVNLPAPQEDNDPARLRDLKDVTIDILQEDIEAVAEAAAGPAAEAAVAGQLDTKVDKGFNSIPNRMQFVGDFNFYTISTTEPPPPGMWVGVGGNSIGFNTLVSDPDHVGKDGDDQRAQVVIAGKTTDDGNSEEQMVYLQNEIETGYSKPWATSTAFTFGDNITQPTNAVYRCIQSGTSAATGSGPSGLGDDITDGTVRWMWINDAAINAKLTLYNETVARPGGGSAWAQVNNFELESGYNSNFACNTEFDLTNNTGIDSTLGGLNRYGVWVACQGTNTSTAALQISSANTVKEATLWGAYFAGTKLASRAVMCFDASAPIGIGFGNNAGGVVQTNYTTATIRDKSITPTALSLGGEYSSAAISVTSPTSIPAALAASGPKSSATIVDLSTGPMALNAQGTYTVAGVEISGSAPAAFSSTGSKSIGGFVDASTAPYGFNAIGTYSTAAFASNNFEVRSNGNVRASAFRFLTVPPNYADDAAAAAGGLLIGDVYRTASVLKVRVA